MALLESRRSREAAGLVRRYGGQPLSMPVLRETPLDDEADSVAALRRLCAEGTDAFICLTGGGTRRLFDLASQHGFEAGLRQVWGAALMVVRGPKPATVLRELGIRIDRAAAPPHTSTEVLAAIEGDAISRAAVQLYGLPDPILMNRLTERHIDVLALPVYRYGFPDDLSPVLDFLRSTEQPDVLAITSASQVHNLFDIAEVNGLAGALQDKLRRMTIAAVGPVSARAAQEHGLAVSIQPENSTLGALIREIARCFSVRT